MVVRTDAPDLLITDIRLQEYNGLQLIVSSPRHLPAIVITGFADPVLEAETRRTGAEYIVKPVDPRALLETVKRKLSASKDGFQVHRRWERKHVFGLSAEIAGAAARIVDISYGGMRLEMHEPPERTPGARLAISIPAARLALSADLVWANRIHAETWALGASIGAEATVPDWRRVVDAAS